MLSAEDLGELSPLANACVDETTRLDLGLQPTTFSIKKPQKLPKRKCKKLAKQS